MTSALPADKLQLLCTFITKQTGILIPAQRLKDLEGALLAITQEFGFADVHTCLEWLLADGISRKQVKILARYITIGETYFNRDTDFFTTLRKEILPPLIQDRKANGRYLRIWSAACCTGEEAYSVAIVLKEMIPDLKKWDITLIGTDININFIKKAQQGIYRPWSFRKTPAWFMKYFTKTKEGNYKISDEIRKMVKFSFLNLVEDLYPADDNNTDRMDMIFCRNALMYFPPNTTKKVIGKFYHSLNQDGWLALSACESSFPTGSKFAPVFLDKTTLFRKGPGKVVESSASAHLFTAPDLPIDISPPPSDLFPVREQEQAAELFAYNTPVAKESTADITAPLKTNHYQEAHAHYEQGRYRDAEEKLIPLADSEVCAQEGNQTMILLLLTRIYANQGKIKEALGWCEQLVAMDKLNPAAYFLRATILMENDDIEESVLTLRQALYLDQDFTLAHFLLANQMRMLGKDKIAMTHFSNALALLDKVSDHEILPESEGISAGNLRNMINATLGSPGCSASGGRL